jgi:branched-chain amino acid transport system ATP-binding protein
VLKVTDLSVDFGGVRAVDDVSFALDDGETLGIIGPNGSGKTTLLNALTGVVKASGHASLDDRTLPLGKPAPLNRAGINRVFQAPQIFGSLTCLENVLVASRDRRWGGYSGALVNRPSMWRAERRRWERAHEVLDRVGLADLSVDRGDSLTYGQQRLLELARALVAEPRILLLDEPSAGLNDAETHALAQIVESAGRAGTAIAIVDHKMSFVERLCPRLMVMDFGKVIVEGTPEQVWSDARVIEAYLGAPDA